MKRFLTKTTKIATAVVLLGSIGACGLIEDAINQAKELAAQVAAQIEEIPNLSDLAAESVETGLDALELDQLAGGLEGIMPGIDVAGAMGGGADQPRQAASFAPLALGDSCLTANRGETCTMKFEENGELFQLDVYVDPTLTALKADGTDRLDDNGDPQPALHIIDAGTTLDYPRRSGTRSIEDLTFANGSTEADLFVDDIRVTQVLNTKREAKDVRETKITVIYEGSTNGAPDGDLTLNGLNGVQDTTDTVTYFERLAELRNGMTVREIADPVSEVEATRFDSRDDIVPGSYSKVVKNPEGRVTEVTENLEVGTDSSVTFTKTFFFKNGKRGTEETTIDGDTITIHKEFPGGKTVDASINTATGAISRTVKFPADHPLDTVVEEGEISEDGGATITKTITPKDGDVVTVSITITVLEKDARKIEYDRSDGANGVVIIDKSEDGQTTFAADATSPAGVHVTTSALVREDGSAELEVSIDRPDVEGNPDAWGTLVRDADGHISGTLTVQLADGTTKDIPVDMEGGSSVRKRPRK